MKLLTLLTSVSIPVKASAQTLFSAVVVFALIGLETARGFAESDRHDGLAALALLCLIAAVAVWHTHRPLGWVDWLLARGRRLIDRATVWEYEHGIDFGGSPAFPSRLPPIAWTAAALLVGWGAFAVVVWYLLPGGWRQIGIHSSYVLYLGGLLALWGALLVGLIVGLFVPVVLFDRALRDVLSDTARRRIIFFACVGYLIAVSLAAFRLPVGVVLAVCGFAVALALRHLLFPGPGDVALLWRRKGRRAVFAVPLPRVLAGALLVAILAYVNLILTGLGGRITTLVQPDDAMRLTGFLAALVAWTAPGLLAVSAVRVWMGLLTNPARMLPPTVNFDTRADAEGGRAARAAVEKWGWWVRPPNEAVKKTDVRCEVVPAGKSQATEFDPVWPLELTAADLAIPDVKHRLQRRDEIQMRRRIFRGVRHLFKRAAAEREEAGGSFWFAPHWWFVDSLGREEGSPDREDGTPGTLRQVGPSFGRIFGVRPRQHLYRILRAVKVDVIHVEDGVSGRAVERVLRAVMEVYDIHDGRRAVDDHCFPHMPKIRVTVHDFGPDAVVEEDSGFQQPTFDDLSRGRVLQIARDHGDHEEPVENPWDTYSAPSPVLVA